MKPKKVAFLGLCVALSMILSYFEGLIPMLIPVYGGYGIKVGFANLVTIFMLYKFSAKETVAVSIIRVILMSILFPKGLTFAYSLAGATLSLVGMIVLKRSKLFSSVTVSVVGAILHNIGQIIIAVILMETSQIAFYLPVLLISGTIAGVVIGIAASLLVKRLDRLRF